MTDDLLIVRKTEHHLWRTCPCGACAAERGRHPSRIPPTSLRRIPLEVAHSLGFLKSRNPYGSLARELMVRGGR